MSPVMSCQLPLTICPSTKLHPKSWQITIDLHTFLLGNTPHVCKKTHIFEVRPYPLEHLHPTELVTEPHYVFDRT